MYIFLKHKHVTHRYNLGYTFYMKTAISIPDSLFEVADRMAKRLGLSRSKLYQRALERFIRDLTQETVTEDLNRVYNRIFDWIR